MNWTELSMDQETLTKAAVFIHKKVPNYVSGKKYRLPGDPGHKKRITKIGEENAQFTRRIRVFYRGNHVQSQIKLIDGKRTIYADRDDMFDDAEYTIAYTTTYNQTFTFPCESTALDLLNKIIILR